MPHRPNAANGFLVTTPAYRIWFAGDTSPFPAMADLPALAGGPIDLALIPVGGWGPRLSGGHMDPVQAARACVTVGARAAVPVHWGRCTHRCRDDCRRAGWTGPARRSRTRRRGWRRTLAVHVVAPGERLELS